MNDFFDKVSEELNHDNENKDTIPENTQPLPEKVKVGDAEYDSEELSQLVGLGKQYKEIETKYNTKLDKVWPEYTKSQNKIKELEEELAKRSQPDDISELTPEQKVKAKQALEQILGGPVMTQQEFRQAYLAERQAERLIEEAEDLAETYNGADGRPVFKTEDILRHMAETGIKNPEKAYKDKYEKELDAWREQQLNKAKKPGLYTETTTTSGTKQPTEVKPNRDNLSALIRQSLGGGDE